MLAIQEQGVGRFIDAEQGCKLQNSILTWMRWGCWRHPQATWLACASHAIALVGALMARSDQSKLCLFGRKASRDHIILEVPFFKHPVYQVPISASPDRS
ncbi:unnamed protein product [Effrenium voratum]|nr:unnamed protein product [Effrenium voratum]